MSPEEVKTDTSVTAKVGTESGNCLVSSGPLVSSVAVICPGSVPPDNNNNYNIH